jgi:hypothetical protein
MPSWLSLSSTPHLLRFVEQDSHQQPKLPFEILYAVLDELVADSTEGDRRPPIKIIALTCRAFEAYARAHRYRNLRLRASYVREDGSSTRGFPGPFMEIVRQRPDLLELVQSLSLCFGQSISSDPAYTSGKRSRILGAIGMNKSNSNWKEWAGVLATRSPQLTALTLHFDWEKVSPDIRRGILAMLVNLEALEQLKLDSSTLPIDLLQSLPASLKRLTWIRDSANGESGQPAVPAQSPARSSIPLESFSLFHSASEREGDESLLFEGNHPVDFNSLKHFRFGPISFVSALTANLTFAQQASSSLQCLHIGFHRFVLPSLVSEQAALQINNFPALSVLEITVGRQGLRLGVRWLSNSIATIHVSDRDARLSSLQIVFNVQYIGLGSVDDAFLANQDTWRAVASDPWPNLRSANILAYSSCDAWNRCGCGACGYGEQDHSVPRCLGSFNIGHGQHHQDDIHYHSLWKLCVCSGWWS